MGRTAHDRADGSSISVRLESIAGLKIRKAGFQDQVRAGPMAGSVRGPKVIMVKEAEPEHFLDISLESRRGKPDVQCRAITARVRGEISAKRFQDLADVCPAQPEATVGRKQPDEEFELIRREPIVASQGDTARELAGARVRLRDLLPDHPCRGPFEPDAAGIVDESLQAPVDPYRDPARRGCARIPRPLTVKRVGQKRKSVFAYLARKIVDSYMVRAAGLEPQLLLTKVDKVSVELSAVHRPELLEGIGARPASKDIHPPAVHRMVAMSVHAEGVPGIFHDLEHLPHGGGLGDIATARSMNGSGGTAGDRGIDQGPGALAMFIAAFF